jgi:hypothetical protein
VHGGASPVQSLEWITYIQSADAPLAMMRPRYAEKGTKRSADRGAASYTIGDKSVYAIGGADECHLLNGFNNGPALV